MARLVAAFGSSHSPMLAARAEDWNGGFLGRDRTRAHVDLDGNPCGYDALLANAPADALERIAPERLAQRHAEVQASIARLAGDIAAAKLDALIVVGDDQEELFDQSNMPAIGIYYGETIRNAGQGSIAGDDWMARARRRYLEPSGAGRTSVPSGAGAPPDRGPAAGRFRHLGDARACRRANTRATRIRTCTGSAWRTAWCRSCRCS